MVREGAVSPARAQQSVSNGPFGKHAVMNGPADRANAAEQRIIPPGRGRCQLSLDIFEALLRISLQTLAARLYARNGWARLWLAGLCGPWSNRLAQPLQILARNNG